MLAIGVLFVSPIILSCESKIETKGNRSFSDSDKNQSKEDLLTEINELTLQLSSYKEQIVALDGNPNKESLEKQASDL